MVTKDENNITGMELYKHLLHYFNANACQNNLFLGSDNKYFIDSATLFHHLQACLTRAIGSSAKIANICLLRIMAMEIKRLIPLP